MSATPFDITALRYAVHAAATVSFARAAQQFGVKQATLSRRIAALEMRLDLKLFDRSTRGAILTPAGHRFIEAAQRILSDLEVLGSCGRAYAAGSKGQLRIGFSTSLAAGYMRALLFDLTGRFPDLSVEGVERDRPELIQLLHTGVIDLAFLCGVVQELGLASRSTWAERVLAVVPSTHVLSGKDRLYWPDLRHERFCISSHDPGPDLANLARARMSEPGWIPDVRNHAISRDNLLSLVTFGRCLSLTTDAALGRPTAGVVMKEIHDLSGTATHIHFTAYWRNDNDNPALASALRLIADRYPV